MDDKRQMRVSIGADAVAGLHAVASLARMKVGDVSGMLTEWAVRQLTIDEIVMIASGHEVFPPGAYEISPNPVRPSLIARKG